MDLFAKSQLYRNMNHASFVPTDDTQFDESLTHEDDEEGANNQPSPTKKQAKGKKGRAANAAQQEGASPQAGGKKGGQFAKAATAGTEEQAATNEDLEQRRSTAGATESNNGGGGGGRSEKKKKKKKKKSKSTHEEAHEDEEEGREEDDKVDAEAIDTKSKSTLRVPSPRSSKSATSSPSAPSSAGVPRSPISAAVSTASTPSTSAEATSDGLFSQLLLESILEQKSVSDFIAGLPDKRGAMLVRFPTTTFGKGWKKRYFTLHGDCLYYHEDQSFIHPSPGAFNNSASSSSHSAGSGPDAAAPGVNYKDCKKIDIADFWIIQQDEAEAAITAATSTSSSGSKAPVYGEGQPIPADDEVAESKSGSGGGKSKFDETFKRAREAATAQVDAKFVSAHTGKDVQVSASKKKEPSKPEGPVVRGRRRSSLVTEKGSVVILLMPSAGHKCDPIELTGLNEGSLADLAVLGEWVVAINARICLLNFLHSPMNGVAMARGGREILAFLTDATAKVLRVENKFTGDMLTSVLTHFRSSLSHRSGITIIFRNCAMTDSALVALASILGDNADMVVHTLDLSHNCLTKQGMASLHRALKTNRRIKHVILDSNQIGDEGLDLLVNGPEASGSSPRSRDVKPKAAQPGRKGSSPIASADESSSIWAGGLALHSLSLRANGISDLGFERFLNSITDHLKAQDAVDEEDASRSSPENGAAHHSVRFDLLDFGGNAISDQGIQLLAAFLKRVPGIHALNLSGNFVSDNGVAHLRDFLGASGRQLQRLDLSSNLITSIGLGFIVKALEGPEACKERLDLDMSGNMGIDSHGVAKLLTLREQGVSAVQVHQLAFSVFDPEVLEARRTSTHQGGATSPRASPQPPGHARRSPGVASITASQQGVLDLFGSPISGNHPTHMNYPLVPATSAAPVAATSQQQAVMGLLGLEAHPPASSVPSAVSSASASATPAAATSTTPRSKRRKDRKAKENDTSAPKIAIGPAGSGTRATVQPLHPPPPFLEPSASPEAEQPTPGQQINLPSPATQSNGSVTGLSTDHVDVSAAELLTGGSRERVTKGMTSK